MLPVVKRWYAAFKQFLERSNVDDPARIRNVDETGCPSQSKIWQSSHIGWNIYQAGTDTKEQITTRCAVSAAGDAIPTLHIFSSQRFRYNPFEGDVSGTYMYFRKSEKDNHTSLSWLGSQPLDSHFILRTAPI